MVKGDCSEHHTLASYIIYYIHTFAEGAKVSGKKLKILHEAAAYSLYTQGEYIARRFDRRMITGVADSVR